MPTELHLKKVLNFKQNWEDALKAHFTELGFTGIFTSTDEGDMPDDMMEIIFELQSPQEGRAATAQVTGTGANEACYFNANVEISLALLRLNDDGGSRPASDTAFKNLVTEKACLIKYAMLMGALNGSFNGITGLSLPYYDFRYATLTSESYGVSEEYVKDIVTMTYVLGFSIRGDVWKG